MRCAVNYPRNVRILNKKQYDIVFKKGAVKRTPAFVFYAYPTEQCFARMGVIISKRSASHAVTRNRVKRICREVFRLKRSLLSSTDFVILARPRAKNMSNNELQTCLHHYLDKHLQASKEP